MKHRVKWVAAVSLCGALTALIAACVADEPPTASEPDASSGADGATPVQDSGSDSAATSDASTLSFCDLQGASLFCADFDDLDAGALAGFQGSIQNGGGTAAPATDNPKSAPRSLRAQGVSVPSPGDSFGAYSALLTTNGVPHLRIDFDARLDGTLVPGQAIDLAALYLTDPENPFFALGESATDGWFVALTSTAAPAFVNIASPSDTSNWFHVTLELTLNDGDAGTVSVVLGDRSAQRASVQTAPSVLGNVSLAVGIDTYADARIDASAPFVAHVDNVVVTQ